MKWTLACASLFLASAANAQWAPQPPARFAHEYHGKLTVVTRSLGEIHSICRNPRAEGCTYDVGNPRHCTIYLSPTGTMTYQSKLTHEIGHCNGWSANHEAW